MDATILAYIAGFLDGDGSVFFQLVRRKGYLYGYQIRCSIAFYQKTEHVTVLEWLKTLLVAGYIRHRKTGMSDYTIVEPNEVERVFKLLEPYVRLKSKHIDLGLKILGEIRKVSCANDFLKVCQLVDRYKELNYSKKRTVTSVEVGVFLYRHGFLTPVETSSDKEESHLAENNL
jgi:intein-encoded DNA endonuclease-like protein